MVPFCIWHQVCICSYLGFDEEDSDGNRWLKLLKTSVTCHTYRSPPPRYREITAAPQHSSHLLVNHVDKQSGNTVVITNFPPQTLINAGKNQKRDDTNYNWLSMTCIYIFYYKALNGLTPSADCFSFYTPSIH